MRYLSTLDYVVIGGYVAVLIGLGLYLKKKASASIEDYFIGNRTLPWWALGISGMASWLDVAGTMVIVSFIYMLGPRGLYIEFRGGAGLILPVMLLWAGKWHRRSGCLTGAEWMIFRFGDGAGGRFAQAATSLSAVVLTVGMLAYMAKGVGLFLSTFLPFTPAQCALGLMTVAMIYTMFSGFYGVVFTDLFQSGIILTAVIAVTALALNKITGTDLTALAQQVTGNQDWMSSVPHVHTSMPPGYKAYEALLMFACFYWLKNFIHGSGAGADPKYFGARSDRECGLLSFLWGVMIMFRWPLIMGFAVLGLFLMRDMFPNMNVLTQTAAVIREYVGQVREEDWAAVLSDIVNHPERYPESLTLRLGELLGPDWSQKLKLVSYHGTVNAERVLPAVLLHSIPQGLSGMMLIALIAASMSTFDSTVNAATGLFTRDVYQKYLRPKASTQELIYASWGFIFIMVALSLLFALSVKNINDIWGWITMGLTSGLIVPGVLKLYWWRFNGSGLAVGMVAGMLGAVLYRLGLNAEILPKVLADERWQFGIMVAIGTIGSIIGTYISGPTNPPVLEHFYRKTRPFGLWGPLWRNMPETEQRKMHREHLYDIATLPFAFAWHICLLLLPMQLLIGTRPAFAVTLAIAAVGLIGMYVLWYRQLPTSNMYED